MAFGNGARVELGRFLRARRERLSPEVLGLPPARHRRTPGLRREEVAVAAGISITWYTNLEQGRTGEVSPSVLDSLARVLQLSEDERRYLHVLMYGHVVGPSQLADLLPLRDLVANIVEVAGRHPYPVYSLDRVCDVIAWNDATTEWYEDWSVLPPDKRNFMRWMFDSAKAKRRVVDWDEVGRDLVARWRAELARHPDDDAASIVAEFRGKSPEFARWWDERGVLEHRVTTRRLRHPRLGIRELCIVPVLTVYEGAPWIFFHFSND